MRKKNPVYDMLTQTRPATQKDEDKIKDTFDDETLDYMFDMEEDVENLGEIDEDTY